MKIYLIRHAHALDGQDDAARPLSKRGHAQVRAMARFLKKSGMFEARELWHSPLVRSRETAALWVKHFKRRFKLVDVDGLQPFDDPTLAAKRLKTIHRPVVVVGHEPHLSALASLLVAGAAEPPLFVLKKCAVLALERSGGRWSILWQVSPELAGQRL